MSKAESAEAPGGVSKIGQQKPTSSLSRYRSVIHYLAGYHWPGLFYALHQLREGKEDGRPAVSRDTELVIEGYPRSGNTFAVHAFRLAQNRPVKIAHHLHVPAQIMRAARFDIPTLVLIREPESVVRSMMLRHGFLRPADALRGYAMYYRKILAYRDSFVAARFEDVIDTLDRVIEHVNWRFGTEFIPFEPTQSNVDAAFRSIERRNVASGRDELSIARPSETKDIAKRDIDLSRCERILGKCHEVYDQFCDTVQLIPARAARS